MPIHGKLTSTDVHVAHAWEYADAAERGAATGFVAADVGKLALQENVGALFRLTSVTPTWVRADVSLSEYQNVVVVDPGGRGDHATVGAACAAITDSAVDNRYLVMVFGETVETEQINIPAYTTIRGQGWNTVVGVGSNAIVVSEDVCEIEDLFVQTPLSSEGSPSAAIAVTAGSVIVRRVKLRAYNAGLVASGGDVQIWSCDLEGGSSAGASGLVVDGGATVLVYHSAFSALATYGISITHADADVTLFGCRITGVGGMTPSPAFYITADATVRMYGGWVYSPSSRGGGLNVVDPLTSAVFSHVHFRGVDGWLYGVMCENSTWTSAPFYHCVFEGGAFQITPAAGTASGTNVVI